MDSKLSLTSLAEFIKKYFPVLLVTLLLVIIAGWVYFVGQSKTPETPPAQKIQPVVLEEIIPGQTSISELKEKVGEPTKEQAGFYEYPSKALSLPNQVAFDGEKVVFVREIVLTDVHELDKYKQKYGEPEGEFFGSAHDAVGFKVYVFAKSGVAVVANSFDGAVAEVWRFEPMNLEEFLNSWGKGLTKERVEADGP